MPGKLKIGHHTIADWDFEKGSQYRSLAGDYYISEPTSLKFSGLVGAFSSVVLCRIPETLVLPQGEFRHWKRGAQYGLALIVFRNQAALGSADYQNMYYVSFAATVATLRRIINGSGVTIGSTSFPTSLNTWEHFRVVYYNGHTPAEAEALCVDLYKEIAGEWVKQGSTLYDTTNKWKDSSINRSGFWCSMTYGNFLWLDDSEVWGPV